MKQNKLNELYDLMEKAQSGLEEIRRELKEQSESKPKFKVGDWVVYREIILKISGITGNRVDFYDNTWMELDVLFENYRLATESEVREHLIAEAKKKGFVDGLELSGVDGKPYAGKINNIGWKYSLSEDTLWNCGAQIYKQSVWATIKDDELVIDGHGVELDGEYVKVGCKEKHIVWVKDLYKQIYWFNYTITGGCKITSLTIDNSNKITVEQLKQIVDYIEKYER